MTFRPGRFVESVERHPRIALAGILLVALAVRLGALASWNGSVYRNFLIWDERTYVLWASKILQGSSFTIYDFAPLYAYLMAGVFKITSSSFMAMRIVNITLGVAACGIIYAIGTELSGRRIGLAAAFVAALYRDFIFFNITLLKESAGIFFVAASIWLLVVQMRRRSVIGLLCMGAAIAMAASVRGNAVAFMPVATAAVAWAAWRDRRAPRTVMTTVAACLAGYLIASAPFILKNYRESGAFSTTTLGGFNFYIANNPGNALPFYRPVPFATSVPHEQAVQFIIEAARREGRQLTPSEAAAYWSGEAVSYIMASPVDTLTRMGWKAMTVLSAYETEDNYHIGFVSRFVRYFKTPFIPFWLVIPLGLAGLAMAVRTGGSDRVLAAAAMAYSATLVLYFTNTRINTPLVVIVIPYAVMAAGALAKAASPSRRETSSVALPATVALVCGVLSWIPVPGIKDMTSFYNAHAVNLLSIGRRDEAMVWYKESVATDGSYAPYARLALAGDLIRRGDAGSAEAFVTAIPDDSFAASNKYDMLGDIHAATGRDDDAVAGYRRSLAINGGQVAVHEKLIRLYRKLGRHADANDEAAKLRDIQSYYRFTKEMPGPVRRERR